MAINLATLDVALRSVGGDKVQRELDAVDRKGRATGRTVEGLGASARRAQQGMAAGATGARNLGETVARLATSSQGARVMSQRIAELSKGAQIAGTRAVSLERLRLIEAQLTAALQRGNLTVQQRIVLERQLTATRAGLAATGEAAIGAERGVSAFGATLRALGVSVAAFSVARLVGGLFEAATTAEETASKFETTMGQSADSVRAFLREFGPMAGLSRTVGEEMTATAAAIVQGMGMSRDASAKFSVQIIKTAGDLQSFHNIPIAETFAALRAGIVGEYEPLRRLGIVLTEATVKQRALADTGKTHVAQLTQQELATTRLTMAIERMGVANGDLERTQHATQNQARRTKAELENLRIELAQYLSGAFASAVASASGLVRLLARNGPLIAGMVATTVTIGALTLAVKAYSFAVGTSAVTGTTRFVAALTALRAAALNPVVIGVTAVAAAIGVVTMRAIAAKRAADDYREAQASLAATTRQSRDALKEYRAAQEALDKLPAAASADERKAAYDRVQTAIRALMDLGPDYQRAIEDEIGKQGDLAAAIQRVTDQRNADLRAVALAADQAVIAATRQRQAAERMAGTGLPGVEPEMAGRLAEARAAALASAKERERQAVEQAAEAWRNYARATGRLDVPEPETGTDPEDPNAARRLAEARAAALAAGAERELAIRDATRAEAQAIEDAALQAGLRSLDTYYANRRQMMEQAAADEIRALETQRRAVASVAPEDEAGRVRQQTELAGIDNQILVRQRALARERVQLAATEAEARRQLADQLVDHEQRVLTAQGRTREAALLSVDEQVRAYDQLLAKQGVALEERERLTAAYREPLVARVEFDEAEREAQRVLAELEAARTRIRQQVEIGAKTEIEAQQEIAQLERERLPRLEALADAMEQFAQALGNADLTAAVERFRASLTGLGTVAQGIGQQLGEALVTGVVDSIGAGFEALGRDGRIGNGLQAMGAALLGGFGGAIKQFGYAVIAASGLMAAMKKAFMSLNPVAMAAAGIGMVALGSFLQGAAQRAMGGGGGGGGGAVASVPRDTTTTIPIGTPGLGGVGGRTAGAPAPTTPTLATATVRPADLTTLARPVAPVTVTGNVFASPYDSQWRSAITGAVRQAQRNGEL